MSSLYSSVGDANHHQNALPFVVANVEVDAICPHIHIALVLQGTALPSRFVRSCHFAFERLIVAEDNPSASGPNSAANASAKVAGRNTL